MKRSSNSAFQTWQYRAIMSCFLQCSFPLPSAIFIPVCLRAPLPEFHLIGCLVCFYVHLLLQYRGFFITKTKFTHRCKHWSPFTSEINGWYVLFLVSIQASTVLCFCILPSVCCCSTVGVLFLWSFWVPVLILAYCES